MMGQQLERKVPLTGLIVRAQESGTDRHDDHERPNERLGEGSEQRFDRKGEKIKAKNICKCLNLLILKVQTIQHKSHSLWVFRAVNSQGRRRPGRPVTRRTGERRCPHLPKACAEQTRPGNPRPRLPRPGLELAQ